MGDELRRSLARAAGDGDIDAARKLVTLLQRENLAREWPLPPETVLRDLADEDFLGNKVRILNLVNRAMCTSIAKSFRDRAVANAIIASVAEPTLRDVACLTIEDLKAAKGCGPRLLATLDSILARASLALLNDPTLRPVPMANPSASSPSEGPTAP